MHISVAKQKNQRFNDVMTTLRNNEFISLTWGASSRWLFLPNSAWGGMETEVIGKTHSTLNRGQLGDSI